MARLSKPSAPATSIKTTMATVHPPLSDIRATSPGEYVELDILKALAARLPDGYTLFHRVDWTCAEPRRDSHGELDIVVVNSAGDMAVLEVKAGSLDGAEGGLFKLYGSKRKNVGQQAGWQFRAILQRLRAEDIDVRLLHFLVLPHHRIGDEGTIDYPRERIADAEDCLDIAGFVQRRLGTGRPGPVRERVHAFLLDRLDVQPDISAQAGTLERQVNAISGGLARWVPRIGIRSGVIHVRATAGSGKTQLALALLRQACVAGQSASYVCFNRPLADQMRALAPSNVEVSTFHRLCWAAAGSASGKPDFDALARRYLAEMERASPTLDMLVIDELQDMQAEWVQALIARVREQGRLYLLEDPEQCLYADRAQIEIDEAVTITARENYRSPRRIVETINLLRLTDEPVTPSAPLIGEPPRFVTYGVAAKCTVQQATADAVRRCLAAGYALTDIVVLCWRGQQHSALLAADTLADWTLSRFTGTFDTSGRPVYSEGELTIETVRRFKGRAASAIVLTEVDFYSGDVLWRSLLFVGLTRARMHVEVVLSEAAESVLASRLAGA
ncbi:AAA family ATPase [Caballeronia sp. GACF5]|nr:AAA family ATPase [Caballeronia sp. GACF5]